MICHNEYQNSSKNYSMFVICCTICVVMINVNKINEFAPHDILGRLEPRLMKGYGLYKKSGSQRPSPGTSGERRFT